MLVAAPAACSRWHVFLSGSSGHDLVAVNRERKKCGSERLGTRADLHYRFVRKRRARVRSFSIREKVAMTVQRNRDDRSEKRRSLPWMATGRTLFLGQVRLHDAVDYSPDRRFLATGIRLCNLIGAGQQLLGGYVRRDQNRERENQAKTTGNAIHNIFFGQLFIVKRRLLISTSIPSKTFQLHERREIARRSMEHARVAKEVATRINFESAEFHADHCVDDSRLLGTDHPPVCGDLQDARPERSTKPGLVL